MKLDEYFLFKHKDDHPYVSYVSISILYMMITCFICKDYDWFVFITICGACFVNNNLYDKYIPFSMLLVFALKKIIFQ